MRWVWVIFLAIAAAVLQVSIMGALRIGGIVPNLVLILVVVLVAWGTASEALVVAVVGGLILDVSGAGTFGLAASSLVVICLALVALRQLGVDGHALPTRVGMVAVATLTWGIIHIVSIGVAYLISMDAWRIILTEILINCIVSILFRERLIHGARTI